MITVKETVADQFYSYPRFWVYTITLFLGYTVAGWFLAAFEVPWLVWLITGAVLLYLAKVGEEAIVLANAWLVLIMFIGTILKTWPTVWLPDLPFQNAPLWAMILMGLWAFSMVLIIALAWGRTILSPVGLNSDRLSFILLGIPLVAMIVGSVIFRLGWMS
ncbi:hypothetical protein B9T07_05280 [Limnospira fusiformis CCALA 023]|uniref:hypothetical protein n=1 Tax=Arthrospira sp. PCC 8006 TaxID=1982224 RepID=UPI00396DAB2E